MYAESLYGSFIKKVDIDDCSGSVSGRFIQLAGTYPELSAGAGTDVFSFQLRSSVLLRPEPVSGNHNSTSQDDRGIDKRMDSKLES